MIYNNDIFVRKNTSLNSENNNAIILIYMKSPPPCGDITPMEVVSNSRAEPQS